MVQNWFVSSKFSNSDHRYIQFEVAMSTRPPLKEVRFARNTDWDRYREELSKCQNLSELNSESHEINTHEEMEEATESLLDCKRRAFRVACPITYIANDIKKPPWLTPEVESAQRQIQHKLMRARASKSIPAWEEYKTRLSKYKKLLRKTKRTSWREFCRKVESVKENARMYKILKGCHGNHEKLGRLYKKDNTLSNTPEETLEVLAETHFQGDPPDIEEVPPPIQVPPETEVDNILESTYSPERMLRAVQELEPYKAPGPDAIHPIMITEGWELIANITRTIMKYSHRHNCTPQAWRESKAIFIAKPGKTDYCKAKSFRTITLSSTLLKLQERLVYWHMLDDQKMATLTSARQFGFKKGVSTETALHKIVHKIEKRIANKGYVLGTFLDIEGAFDNVSFGAISKALYDSPIDSTTAGWITNMVANRHVTIEFKGVTKRIRVRRGCPQGGVLSPFLWNLIVDDLLNYTANKIPGYLQAFADDLICLCEGLDLDVIRARTQKTIDTIESWCKTKGLNVSALKTQVVMFTWRNKWALPKPITVSGKRIDISNHARFLGVTLDSKLNFNQHIINICNKATASLMQCKRAVGPTWGLSPKTCLWIYTRVIRPMISYSSVIWVNALNKQYNTKKLERIQAMALRIASGAMPGTSNSALDHITNLPNIGTYLKGEAAKAASRLKGTGEWTTEVTQAKKGTILSHTTINNSYLNEVELPCDKQDLTKPILKLNTKYSLMDTKITALAEHRAGMEDRISDIPKETITCYTDGSKTDSGTGYGFYISTNNNQTELARGLAKLPDYCTVYQAELSAITAAANALTNNTKGAEVVFLTDSLSSIQTLNNKILKSRTAIKCHHALTALGSECTVSVIWIPGHEGHEGNEKADQLAKEGTTSEQLCEGFVPQSHIKNKINEEVRIQTASRWNLDPHKHTTLALGPANSSQHQRAHRDLHRILSDRDKYRTATQLITGHIALNSHLNKMTLVDSNVCPSCESEAETVEHFVGQCPAYASLRNQHLGTYYDTMANIFKHNSVTKIVSYAKHTGRLVRDHLTLDDSGVT